MLNLYAKDDISKFQLVEEFQSAGVRRSKILIDELDREINQNILRYCNL